MIPIVKNLYNEYRVTSPYGPRGSELHTGIDLAKQHKSPVYALIPGTVIYSQMGTTGSGYGGFGNVVAVKDYHGNVSMYAHLHTICAKVGDNVIVGQQIGTQGYTGKTSRDPSITDPNNPSGSHLHFEVRIGGKLGNHTDPVKYLEDYYKSEKSVEVVDIGNINFKMGHVNAKGIVVNGVSMVPARVVADALGRNITWDGKSKTVEIK